MNETPTTPCPFSTARLLGYELVAARAGAFLEAVLAAAASRDQALAIGYLNAAQVNLAFDDPAQARRLAALDWLYADGHTFPMNIIKSEERNAYPYILIRPVPAPS